MCTTRVNVGLLGSTVYRLSLGLRSILGQLIDRIDPVYRTCQSGNHVRDPPFSMLRVGAGTGGWRLGLDGEETTDAGWYNVALRGPPALRGLMRAEDIRSKLSQSWVRNSGVGGRKIFGLHL